MTIEATNGRGEYAIAPVDAVLTTRLHPAAIANTAGLAMENDLSRGEVQALMAGVQQIAAEATMRGADMVLESTRKAAAKRLVAIRQQVMSLPTAMGMGTHISRERVIAILDAVIHTRPIT